MKSDVFPELIANDDYECHLLHPSADNPFALLTHFSSLSAV